MPHPQLTDDAVSRLPLHGGRAELLEEIMSTPVIDDTTTSAGEPDPRRSTRWLVPVAAAAAVAVLATAPVWWPSGSEQRIVGPAAPAPSAATSLDAGYRAVLDAPGWTVENTSEDPQWGGEVSFAKGDQRFDVSWYPQASYAEYVEDREHIYDPPAPGEPVEVLGIGGQLWHYSDDDHTVIREVQAGHWMEFRGSGMDDAAYRALLEQLRLVDQDGLEAALPPQYVASGERAEAIQAMLDGIDAVADPLAPPGVTLEVDSEESDPYHLGADVTSAVACAWIGEFAAAREAGDQARMTTAQDVLATSRDWPVLQEMEAEGDWSLVVWEFADAVSRGKVPPGYEMGIGCDG